MPTQGTAEYDPLAARLSRDGPLDQQAALRIVARVAERIAQWHARGAVHGGVSVEAVLLGHSGVVSLRDPSPALELRGDDSCPPELAGLSGESLPREIAPLRQRLVESGIDYEPAKIDIFQLGCLLIRLLGAGSVSEYLRSPRAFAAVPGHLTPLIDRALGYGGQPYDNLPSFLSAVRDAEASSPADAASSQSDTSPSQIAGEMKPDTATVPNRQPQGKRAAEAPPFSRLGHYEVLERIGRGGMGDVYKGFDTTLGRNVAIKVLPAEMAREDEFVRRFKAEASAAARLTHPNIVQIYSIGEEQGRPFFAMQFVTGESLAELLAKRKQLTVDETLTIIEQVLAGLAAAHRQGLVHRDIKPGNILLDRQHQQALLADFGLVKSIDAIGDRTATGVIVGTVDYISPEQGRGRAVDARSDLYSIGVVIFQMLCGRLPFDADSATAMIFQHVYEAPPDLSAAAPQTPQPLAAVVARLLAKDPSDRFDSADQVLGELRSLRRERSAASGVFPRTQIIIAPQFDDALVDEIEAASPEGWFRRTQDRALSLFRRRAPELARRLQNTQQQVDGAVAEYERRCRQLEALVREGEEAAKDLQAQAEEHRRAAARASLRAEPAALTEKETCEAVAAELDQQHSQQQEELEAMRLRLAKAKAVVLRLKSQRDLLAARLGTAQAGYQLEAGVQPRRLRKSVIAATAIACAAGACAAALWIIFGQSESKEIAPVSGEFVSASTRNSGGNIQRDPNDFFLLTSQSPVKQIAFDPSSLAGYRFAVATEDGTFSVCSSAAERSNNQRFHVKTIYGGLESINDIAYSPDGKRIATAGEDHTVRLWQAESGDELRRYDGHTDSVYEAAFSADGGQLLSGGNDGTVRLWDVQSARQLNQFSLHMIRQNVRSVAWSPDGAGFLIGAGVHGGESFGFWNIGQNEEVMVMKNSKSPAANVAFLRNGQHAICVTNGKLHTWEVSSGSQLARFGEKIRCAAYSADGLLAVTGDEQGNVIAWNTQTGKELAKIPSHTGPVDCVAVSRDGDQVASASGKAIRFGKLPSYAPVGQITAFRATSAIRTICFSPDGFWIASGDQTSIRVWNADSNGHDYSMEINSPIASASFSPDGARIAYATSQAGGAESLLGYRDAGAMFYQAGRDVRKFSAPGEITCAAFAPDGGRLVSAGSDGFLRVWQAASEEELLSIDAGNRINSFALTRVGNQLLSGGDDQRLRLWSLAEKKEVREFEAGHTFAVHSVSLSRDAKRAASGGGDRKVIAWEVEKGTKIAELGGHTGAVRSVAITSDGGRILSSGDDGVVRLWDVASKTQVNAFYGHVGAVRAVAVAPNGQRGVSGGDDGTVRVWDLNTPPRSQTPE